MKNNLFAIHTLGCKVNLFESNSVVVDLTSNGYLEVDFNSHADIYIINTCSVTGIADSKSKNYIRRAKRINPNAITVVMGCYSQMNPNDAEELNVDIWIGNKYKNQLINLIDEFVLNNTRINRVENLSIEREFEETKIETFPHNTRAFIKIQDGCNFMCSYCIIPFSRGRQRSKNMENIIIEVIRLVNLEFSEIVITGVNTAGYLDPSGNNFSDLLIELNRIEGDFRIRISSIEPFQINETIINTITQNPKRFCQQWHICLQSGSDDVLKAMNRKYTTEEFYTIIEKIRLASPRTTFTTDYIVGFPTETDQDHQDSITFLKKVQFLKIHIFPYSKRKNTKAANLKDINPLLKKARFNEIGLIEKELALNVMKNFINKDLTVIFESNSDNNEYQKGYSDEYIPIIYISEKSLHGKKIILKGKEIIHEQLKVE